MSASTSAAVATLLQQPARVFRHAGVTTMLAEARSAHKRGTSRTVASLTQLLCETAQQSPDVEVVDAVCQGMHAVFVIYSARTVVIAHLNVPPSLGRLVAAGCGRHLRRDDAVICI